ncbi:4Fe-4S dicluster domain-containing protein [Bacteroidales bacterium OttesenSCG-928-B11]|nr:4Fe-4S dicluster domain-containing protein [Bacteroidales bacterium OttesenSCG-928-C03]MDL2311600.1 4Fe-4S dicluster domain-containing protein [Bacteroidales bacterium OttesenSCG-928-B11]MDL2326715.1 4Fe-4S dicluster domain-containing protein [Bacteroidales bacterium OttesenSCG-928-A14]
MIENILDRLKADIRFQEGLTSCMNCGICTAICPAAEFYKYDPRVICNIVQSRNINEIEQLLKGDEIWYCGQCMSCKTRCPRGNAVGMVITVLRKLSQETGYFVESEKGRQQFAIEKAVGQNIINQGYCVHPDIATYENHPEQGPVWKWYLDNIEELSTKMGAIYKQRGAGALRDVGEENLDEIKKIFEVTGGMAFYDNIEQASQKAAEELGVDFQEEYFMKVYSENSGNHNR